MSKGIDTVHEFEKEKFAELLMRAKGPRTQAQFAQDCGLSATHLNRYFNMRKEQPPVPSTIIKIAKNAVNDVTCEELLDAAGYDPEENYEPKVDLSNINNMYERLCLSQVITCLANCSFRWNKPSIEDPYTISSGNLRTNLKIDIEDSDAISHWYFEIKHIGLDTSSLVYFYGRLCMLDIPPKTKVSLVIDSEESLKMIRDFSPLALPIYFSVILYDVDSGLILKEEYLQTALEIPDDLKTIFTLEGKN